MGSDAHLIVVGGSVASLERARDMIGELEATWSRFLDNSEVTVLNRQAGRPVPVSAETLALVERALEGARVTEGRYDPTLLRHLERVGYDRSFELLAEEGSNRVEEYPLALLERPGSRDRRPGG